MKIVISEQIAQAIQLLPSAEMQAAFFSVYFAYVTTGAEPDDTIAPEVRAMFLLAKPQIDRLNRAAIRKREAPSQPPICTAESQKTPTCNTSVTHPNTKNTHPPTRLFKANSPHLKSHRGFP